MEWKTKVTTKEGVVIQFPRKFRGYKLTSEEEVEENEGLKEVWQLQNIIPQIVTQVTANVNNANGENGNGGNDGCSYKTFTACNPKEFDGKGGVVALTRWIEKIELVSDQAKEIKLLKAKITKLKKQAKPVIKHHTAYLKTVSLQQRFPRKSFSKKHRVHKKQKNAQSEGRSRDLVDEDKGLDEDSLSTEDRVSTDKEKVSTCTEEQREGTEEKVESTAGQIDSTKDQSKEEIPTEASQTSTQTPTSMVFGDNETIATLLLNMSKAKVILRKRGTRSTEDFIAIGSVEDDRLIKKMKKKDSSKEEEIKQESKEEVKQEDKEEENTRKRKQGTRKKIKSRKRRFKQDTSQDEPSNTDKENDELRLCLTIAPDEDKEVDYEILDKKYPIIDWKTKNFGTKPQLDESKRSEEINLNVVTRSNGQKRFFSTLMTVLSVFDREDLDAVYKLVMDIYQDKIPEGFDKVLWGDLTVMFNPDEQDEFWNSQHEWNIISWKLHSSSGVHTLMTDEGLVVHMLIEKKYPLKKEIVVQMLKLKLESEEESTMALELIRFIKKSWLVQDQTVLGKDYSNLLIADSLLKTIWFINAPCYDNEALASPNSNDEELSIPEQTATGKGTSNPLMAGSLPKTTKPT
ncbi:hypothetical protein Tco_1553844 [Tanacetum coccineum]